MNVEWKRKYVKHQMLPISDLYINYQFDREARLLRIDVGHHFDSALLIDFIWRLQRDEGIIVIDTKSHDAWGRATIPDLFRIEWRCAACRSVSNLCNATGSAWTHRRKLRSACIDARAPP